MSYVTYRTCIFIKKSFLVGVKIIIPTDLYFSEGWLNHQADSYFDNVDCQVLVFHIVQHPFIVFDFLSGISTVLTLVMWHLGWQGRVALTSTDLCAVSIY